MRAVGACSSWVVVGNGGAVRVRPARTVGGRPERGPPGTPGDPSRRASSQGAAQQRTLPLQRRAVHVGGPHAMGTTPGRGSRPAGPGRAVEDGPPMMPVRRRSWGHHAVRVGSSRRPQRADQLVVSSLGPLDSQVPATSGQHDRTACVPDHGDRVLPGPPGRGTRGRRRGRPPGGGRPLRVVRGGAPPGERRVAGHLTVTYPAIETAGEGVT